MEKIFEFIIFRRLMKFFERQRLNAHFRAKDVSNAFSTNNDTDDEVELFLAFDSPILSFISPESHSLGIGNISTNLL